MNSTNRGNNNNSNRRRGRGSNNRQQGGGGQQLNRVDSRARGNAPQMLEKYRKLAHDAHLNGDRVQEEYFLQFADHYFRVIADQRQRQEDQRAPRQPGERWQEGGESQREDGEEGGEYGNEGEYQPYDRQSYNRNDREERPREDRPRDERPREDRQRDNRPRVTRQREDRVVEATPANDGGEPAEEPVTAFEPPVNPFVPEPRGARGLRPRRPARPAQDEREADGNRDDAEPRGLDPAMLPPAISVTTARDVASDEAEAATEAAPRRRTRRPRPPADDAGEPLEVAG